MRTLFMHWAGPLMRYDGAFLHIEDLNPQMERKWRLSRGELAVLGLRAVLAALTARNSK